MSWIVFSYLIFIRCSFAIEYPALTPSVQEQESPNLIVNAERLNHAVREDGNGLLALNTEQAISSNPGVTLAEVRPSNWQNAAIDFGRAEGGDA